jgi:heme exporter protein D
MIDLGPHAGFIWLSYAATILAIAGLLIWVFTDERGQRQRLADLERRGIRRRSAPPSRAGDMRR